MNTNRKRLKENEYETSLTCLFEILLVMYFLTFDS